MECVTSLLTATRLLPPAAPAGALDMHKLNEWLSTLLNEKGADIYRSKGILNVAGTDHK